MRLARTSSIPPIPTRRRIRSVGSGTIPRIAISSTANTVVAEPAEFSRGRPDSTPVSFFDLHGLPVCVQDVQLAARILTLGLSISPHGGEPVRAGLQDGEPLENPLSPRG